MVEVIASETLPRNCRGGEHCCRPDSPCGINSGDCNYDHDCQGVSICGTDNCPTQSGGRWDATDDCCERRCTPDHPCREGEFFNELLKIDKHVQKNLVCEYQIYKVFARKCRIP